MSKRQWMNWFAAAWMVLAAGIAHATNATVAADTYVSSASAAANFGNSGTLLWAMAIRR